MQFRHRYPSASRALVAVLLGLTAAAGLVAPRTARAVVIDTFSGTGNTSAPVDDPGWANVGVRGGGTGVYLGDGWVLTANHVGGGTIVLGGVSYAMEAGTGTRLTNGGAADRDHLTDLYLFRLASTPAGLGSVAIAAATPATGTGLTMIGAGRDRGAFTQWSVNTSVTPFAWTEVSSGGNFAGYQTLGNRTMRWGTNAVSGTGEWVDYGSGDVNALYSTFTFSQAYSTEAQATIGDSGGAVFSKNGSTWELTGLMLSVGGFSGQPDPGTTPVFGNVTFMADLSYYRPQIMAIVPEPSAAALAAVGGCLLLAAGWRRRR